MLVQSGIKLLPTLLRKNKSTTIQAIKGCMYIIQVLLWLLPLAWNRGRTRHSFMAMDLCTMSLNMDFQRS